MFNLFGKKQTTESQQAKELADIIAPGTQIQHHPELIDSLKADHARLLSLYSEIKQSFDSAEYEEVSQQLENFKMELQDHLLTENIKLYIYLDHMLGNDEMNSTLIKNFRKEMDEIAKVALWFLSKYEANGVDIDLPPSFETDFYVIGKVLIQRIKREDEVLYPLYNPSY